jgi:hypothetical protein
MEIINNAYSSDNKKPLFLAVYDSSSDFMNLVIGGSAWESNPPGKFLTPHTGFEDRAAHQRPTRFHA